MGLLLVANPGSSSRKYALFKQGEFAPEPIASLNIESSSDGILATLRIGDKLSEPVAVDFEDISQSALHAEDIMRRGGAITPGDGLSSIAVRVVAPGSYFMYDRIVNEEFMSRLHDAQQLAPIHINNVLNELTLLYGAHPDIPVVGISDSAYHITKPSYAWNYGINLQDADTHDIKRFGYHGISVQASIDTLWTMGKLPPKVVVCHFGSGSSVTAVFHGRSVDTTMGYSPLEGVLMSTRSGNIDPVAVKVLGSKLGKDSAQMDEYLNHNGGLLGLGGSNDIRELIEREADGEHLPHLALTTLVHTYHKAIGAMILALGGIDMLVFTGTVGERSAVLRKRVTAHLHFADFFLDGEVNNTCLNPEKPTLISAKGSSKPIMVIPTNESLQIAKRAYQII